MREIITKVHKSWTLLFNWAITVFAVLAEVLLQFAPQIKAEIEPEYYLYFIIFVTVSNKMLRAKTNSDLKDK